MLDPAAMSPGSIMPSYPWLLEDRIDKGKTPAMINAMRKVGVPYPHNYELQANKEMGQQASAIVASLKRDKLETLPDREIVALIAYLQRIGKDIKGAPAKPLIVQEGQH